MRKKKQETYGAANDRPVEVTEEWFAAAYIGNRRDMRRIRYDGEIHQINFLALELDRLRRRLPEPPDAWDWDVSRPIAEQLGDDSFGTLAALNALTAADREDAAAHEDEETLAWRSGRSAPLTPTDPDVVCACTGDDLLLERCAS